MITTAVSGCSCRGGWLNKWPGDKIPRTLAPTAWPPRVGAAKARFYRSVSGWVPAPHGPGPVGCALQVGGGSCCEGCKSGGDCDGKKENVGALIYVTDAEVRVLGDQVATMATDVNAAASAERQSFAHEIAAVSAMKACRAAGAAWDREKDQCQVPYTADPEGRTYVPRNASAPLTRFQLEQWTPFEMRFNAFLPLPPGAVHSASTFEELSAAFKVLHDQWTAGLGQNTRATVPPPPPTNPILPEVGNLAKGLVWFAAVGAGLYFLVPALIPKVASALRSA